MQQRKIGPVSTAAGAGSGLGGALAAILIHFIPSLEPITVPVIIVIGVGLALIGGFLVPPQHQDLWNSIISEPVQDDTDDDLDFDEADILTATLNDELEEAPETGRRAAE